MPSYLKLSVPALAHCLSSHTLWPVPIDCSSVALVSPRGTSTHWQFTQPTRLPLLSSVYCSLHVPPSQFHLSNASCMGISPFICVALLPTGHFLFLLELLLPGKDPSGLLSRGCQHDLSRMGIYRCHFPDQCCSWSPHGFQDEVQTQWLGILDLQWPGLGLPHQHPSPSSQRLSPHPSPDLQPLSLQVSESVLRSLGRLFWPTGLGWRSPECAA